MNIATIIEDHDADLVALIEDDVAITYGQLRADVATMRAALAAAGVGADERVVLVGPNDRHFVNTILATLGLGAIVVPVRPNSPLPELERKLASVSPDLVVVCPGSEWIAEHVGTIGTPVVQASMLLAETVGRAPDIVARSDDDLAFLMLTSGVASDAKVAMLSHGNLGWVQEEISRDTTVGLSTDDVALGALPMTHIFGLNVVLLASLRIGACVVLQRRFDVDESLRLVREHRVTTLTGAPPMWQRWAVADVADDSLQSVRHAASGAAALPVEIFNAVRDRFGVEIAEGYGLTETSPIVTWSRGIEVRPASVGKPLSGVDVQLVEPDGTPVDDGDSGEIVVRSPGVFKGYLDAPELTDNVLTEDGWFWTGDIGVFDSDGYLYLIDRIKDIIIVSGFNVYPGEVESVLMEHPQVAGAVVVGTAHGDTGEAVVAHISGAAEPEDLDQFVRARLSGYKCPTYYHFVDELPVSANGKVIRRELR